MASATFEPTAKSHLPREEQIAYYDALIKACEGLVYVCSKDFEVEYMNEALIKRMGRNACGEKCHKVLYDLDQVCSWCVHERVMGGEIVRWDALNPKDQRWYHIVNAPVYKSNGSVSKIALLQDITERKVAEATFKRCAEENSKLHKVLLDLTKTDNTDFDHTVAQVLKCASEALNVERVSFWTLEDQFGVLRCKKLFLLSKGEFSTQEMALKTGDYPKYMAALAATKSIIANDVQTDDRTIEFNEAYLKPQNITSMMDIPIWHLGSPIGVICYEHVGDRRVWTPAEQEFARSIGDLLVLSFEAAQRKVAELKIQENLNEKEVLLREIHHRVKNNLQMISSLLGLHARSFKQPEYQDIIEVMQGRITAMAFVHAKLYQVESLVGVNVKEYFGMLASHISLAFGSDLKSIKIDLEIEDVTLNIDTMIPIGLIINELLVNAVKHAFWEDQKGARILVQLKAIDEKQYELKVKDNGRGFFRKVDSSGKKSFGLELVTLFVNQLDGQITYRSSYDDPAMQGTEVTLTFRDVLKSNP